MGKEKVGVRTGKMSYSQLQRVSFEDLVEDVELFPETMGHA